MAPGSQSSVPLRMAIIGTGALGSEFCRLLIEAGQADVLLIDPDRLEDRNVATSELFRQAQAFGMSAGMPKVELVRRMADRRGLAWDAMQAEIADVGWLDLSLCDLLVCCADSTLARVETAGTARSLRLPMLDGGVASQGHPHGRASFFPADPEQACYLCGLAEHRRAEILAYALSPSLGCLAGPDFQAMTGGLKALRQVAGELFRLVAAVAKPGAELGSAFALRLDTQTGQKERVTLSRSADCPWHDLPHRNDLQTLPYDKPVAAALQSGPASTLELFWPVCRRARCRRCGMVVAPDARAALVRRRAECSRCAGTGGPGTLESGTLESGTLEPLECVSSLRLGDAAAEQTPRQLGLPERHLYYRRPVAEDDRRRADTQ